MDVLTRPSRSHFIHRIQGSGTIVFRVWADTVLVADRLHKSQNCLARPETCLWERAWTQLQAGRGIKTHEREEHLKAYLLKLFLLLFKAKRCEEVKGCHFEKTNRKKSASRVSVDPDDFAQVLMHSVEIDNVCALLRHLAGAVVISTNLEIEERQTYSKMEEVCFTVLNPSSKCRSSQQVQLSGTLTASNSRLCIRVSRVIRPLQSAEVTQTSTWLKSSSDTAWRSSWRILIRWTEHHYRYIILYIVYSILVALIMELDSMVGIDGIGLPWFVCILTFRHRLTSFD